MMHAVSSIREIERIDTNVLTRISELFWGQNLGEIVCRQGRENQFQLVGRRHIMIAEPAGPGRALVVVSRWTK